MKKETIFQAFETLISDKIKGAQAIFDETVESVQSETKSTAGDKHETGRAQAQLEMEKAGKHIHEMLQYQTLIPFIKSAAVAHHTKIQLGSFIQSEQGYFYLSAGVGTITVATKRIFCIGMQSPIAHELVGKQKNDNYTIAGKTFKILEVH